jgi:MinD-like ATPase involved in chromosome partitioning or flagellar assembly
VDLPTYTNIWRIEKRLYKLYDFRLPMPLPVGQIAVFLAFAVPYVLVLSLLGVPFSHTLLWVYVLPPGVLAWLTTRPVLEGKRLPELVTSQLRYLLEPRTWCRLAPLAEKDEVHVVARVWRRADIAAAEAEVTPVAEDAIATAATAAPAARAASARPAAEGVRAPSPGRGLTAPRPAPRPLPQPSALRGRAVGRPAATRPFRAPSAAAEPASPVPALPQPQPQPQAAEFAEPARPADPQPAPRRPAPLRPSRIVQARAQARAEAQAQQVQQVQQVQAQAQAVQEQPPPRPAQARAAQARPAQPVQATAQPVPAPPAAAPAVTAQPATGPPARPEPAQPPAVQARPAPPAHDDPAPPAEPERRHPPRWPGQAPADIPPPRPPRPVVTVTGDAAERPLRVVERALRSQPGPGRRDRVVVVPGGHRPGKPDQLQRDRARARLPIRGPQRIVVLGCTRGAGQTTTVLLAGDMLAGLRGEPVAVLDLNPGRGSLTEQAAAIPGLVQAPSGGTGDQPPDSGIQVLSGSAADGGVEDAGRMLDIVAARYPLTIADPAAGCVPRTLEVADQLLIVAPASAEAPSALAMTFEWLEAHGHGRLAAAAITVLNGVSGPSAAHVDQAANIANGRCRAIVKVPWDGHLRELSKKRGPGSSAATGPVPHGDAENPAAATPAAATARAAAPASPGVAAPASPGTAATATAPGASLLGPALTQAYTALAGVLVAGLADPSQARSAEV